MGIEGIGAHAQTQGLDQMSGLASEQQVQKAVEEVVPLISASGNLRVDEMRATDKNEKTSDVTGTVPELDEADRELLERQAVDLEALLAKLQADQTEAQIASAKDRIDSLLGQLEQQHETQMNKINESLESLKEQYEMHIVQEALGWLGVVLAVGMAALAVVTCGGATAVFACVGAAIAVTLQVLNETDVIAELTEAIAEAIEDSGLSKEEAEAVAEIIVALLELALSMVGCIGSAATMSGSMAKAGSKAAAQTIKMTTIATTVVNATMAALGMVSSGASAIINYEAAEVQADLTEMEAVFKRLQTMLDEESDDLKSLMSQLMDSMSAVTDLLVSKQDTLNEISMNIGA